MSQTITGNSSMSEVLAAYPGARRALFRGFHIGGCSSCGFQPGEKLADLCSRNNSLNEDEVIQFIQTSHEQDQKMMVTAQAVSEMMKQPNPPKLIDIRSREEHETVSIPGSVLLSRELMDEILNQDRHQAIIFYDHQGHHSLDAGTYFAGHGFTNVQCLKGGIDAWASEIDQSLPRYDLEMA